jgi:hypothetical protein
VAARGDRLRTLQRVVSIRLSVANTCSAVKEYLATLDDAAFGAASDVTAKYVSPSDPAAQWTFTNQSDFRFGSKAAVAPSTRDVSFAPTPEMHRAPRHFRDVP